MLRRRRQALELALGTAFMVGPMIYALTLPTPAQPSHACEPTRVEVVVAPTVCESVIDAVLEPVEPAPVVAPVEPESLDGLAQVLPFDEGRVILTTAAKRSWSSGAFFEPTGVASFRVGKSAALDKLPEQYRRWAGRTYDLYAASGEVCSVTLGQPYVIAQYQGWGLEGVLDEAAYDDTGNVLGGDELPPSRWRGPLWRTQPLWLVADIVAQGDCSGALWARDAALPAPTVLVPSSESTPAAATRLAQFEASPERAQLRHEYREWYASLDDELKSYEPSWATMVAQNPASVTSWMLGEVPRVVVLRFGSDTASCGSGYDAFLGAVDLVEPGHFIPTEQSTSVKAIFDADLDGRWEYLHTYDWDGVWTLESDNPALRVALEINEDFVCPC